VLRTYQPDAPAYACQGDDDAFTYQREPALEYALEHALLFGLGSAGNVVIRERCVWQREWREWRDTIMPKFIAAFPGRRPAAAYIVGEIPLRPMGIDLPLSHDYRSTRCVYVNCGNDGFTYADLPEPYQLDEARHLGELGVIEAEEMRRYRGYGRAAGLAAYQWEVSR
jgi:hypothetical protein